MRPSPGDLIGGKYRIVRLIGDGGMGAVFEARHELLGTPVALKFLHSDLARRTGLVPRFLQEARVSANIQSPHVTRVTDVEQSSDGGAYLVMELLTGESLQQLLDKNGRLSRDLALDFALQILSGLEAAHALSVVHRDLKPDNVYITPAAGGPLVKLLDFGIAKLRQSNEYQRGLTRPGSVMGTPEYMPPEQLFAADQVDHRADLYSLGAILYEMLSGKRPAYGDDAASIIAQVMQGRVRRLSELDPTSPPGLVEVVHRALEPDRQRRWSSALEMRLALIPYAGNLTPAGRLAALPPPGLSSAPTEEDLAVAAKPAQRCPIHQAVAPTLPPDGIGPADASQYGMMPGGKGGTQDVPEQALKEFASALQTPAQPVNLAVAAHPRMGAPSPPYVVAPAPMANPYLAQRTPPRRKDRRALGAIVALLLGLLITTGGIAAVVLLRGRSEEPDSSSSLGVFSATPPTTTISPQPPEPVVNPPQPPAAPAPFVPGRAKPAGGRTTAAPRDAGADAPHEAGFPQFPFPLPSILPPLPSTLPPLLPSTWPPIFPNSNPNDDRH